jgi:hypothetical protein
MEGADMGAAGAGAAAAALRKKRIQSHASFGVVEVTGEDFLKVVALESEPLIVRSAKTKFWSSEPTGQFRYLASVKGLTFFVDYTVELDIPVESILIEAEKITVPKDL